MKSILYIESFTGENAVGGSTISLFHMVTNLRRDIYRPIVLFYYPNKMENLFKQNGIRVFNINTSFDHTKIKRLQKSPSKTPNNKLHHRNIFPFFEIAKSIWHNLPNLKNILTITKIIRTHKIRLIHQNNGIRKNLDGFYAAVLNNIPVVCHDREVPGPINFHHRVLARKINKIICISDALKTNYTNANLPSKKISTVNNCINPESVRHSKKPKKIREEINIPPHAFLLGIVGTITPWKGQEIAVKAMEKLKDKYQDLYCVFVGESITERGRLYKEKLDRLIATTNLSGKIQFIGFKDNIFDYINAFDLLVHTSIKPEPFGRIVIESMAKNRVIIAANAGGIPEIIKHNYNGLLYEPGNSNELARTIELCYQNVPLLEQLGANGFREVSKRYTVDQQIKKIEKIYKDILN